MGLALVSELFHNEALFGCFETLQVPREELLNDNKIFLWVSQGRLEGTGFSLNTNEQLHPR